MKVVFGISIPVSARIQSRIMSRVSPSTNRFSISGRCFLTSPETFFRLSFWYSGKDLFSCCLLFLSIGLFSSCLVYLAPFWLFFCSFLALLLVLAPFCLFLGYNSVKLRGDMGVCFSFFGSHMSPLCLYIVSYVALSGCLTGARSRSLEKGRDFRHKKRGGRTFSPSVSWVFAP